MLTNKNRNIFTCIISVCSMHLVGCKRNIVFGNSSSLLFAFSHNVLSIAYIYMFIRPKSFCRRPSLKHLNKDFAAKFYTYLLQRTSKFSIYSPKNMVTYSHIDISTRIFSLLRDINPFKPFVLI